jgi:hypothetical protein
MVNLIIIEAIVFIGAVVLIVVVFAPRINRWIKGRVFKENEEAVPLFSCSIASKGNVSGTSSSGDIYDCVEAKGKIEETGPKTDKGDLRHP